MATQLEGMTTLTLGQNKKQVRVLHTYERKTKGSLHVFGVYLGSSTGAYTIGEAMVFGDSQTVRRPILDALRKKWVKNKAF